LKALHINWTKPFFARNGGEYFIEDFEILTTILSALKWREKNGSIKMVTDRVGFEFYTRNKMTSLWDDGIDVILDSINEDASMFWAAGKLHALSREAAPVAVIDTDFIVWEEILFDRLAPLCVIHDEDLYRDVYPDMSYFEMKDGYSFDTAWNWDTKALNTAFYVIKDNALLWEYTSEAIRFMNCAKNTGDPLCYMVFAEQRLLNMIAHKQNKEVMCFSTLERLFKHGEGWFTHIWGMKQQMRDNNELRKDFCRRCIDRILKDFPDYEKMLHEIDALKPYMEERHNAG